MKKILEFESVTKDIYCRNDLPYVIISTGENIVFLDRDNNLLHSVLLQDARICDVSNDGRFIAISSFIGIFIIDTTKDWKAKYVDLHLTSNSCNIQDQTFKAFFSNNNELVVCVCSMYVDVESSGELLNETSLVYINAELLREKAHYVYYNYVVSNVFKSGDVMFVHLHSAITSDDMLKGEPKNYQSLLLQIDLNCTTPPKENTISGVNRIFDYDSINHYFLIQKSQIKSASLKSIEIVNQNMKTITSYSSRVRFFDAGWINNGKSIIIYSMLGIVVLDSTKMKPKAKIKGLMVDFPNHRFDSSYLSFITTKKAILYKDE